MRFEGGEEDSQATLEQPAPPALGGSDRIGPYKLLEQLGEGGMGVVYLADQLEPIRRRVALKVIKLGMDTRAIVARFESERQALALMNHPNIASVLDAGMTERSSPYFVMEYVPGVPITDYCDRHRLRVHERLELFVTVCHAIQHAHQKGIIHRDIKPSNVLVALQDGAAVPKVIDFGVAKALHQQLSDATVYTQIGHFVGTTGYMSPEQAGKTGLDVDTRADVYSLGVLLYELVTGTRPFESGDGDKLLEAHRSARGEEPDRPSTRVRDTAESSAETASQRGTDATTLRRELTGDIDWIAMKALESDRTRRYDTVAALADDVRRHLDHEPVLAGPPKALYKVGKFVRRHRIGVLAAATIVLLLAALAVATTLQSVRIRRAFEEAELQRQNAEQVSDFLVDLFETSDPFKVRGGDLTAREILDRGTVRVGEQLSDQPEVQSTLLHAIAAVYERLGLYDQALPLAERALELRRNHRGASAQTAEALETVALIRNQRDEWQEAERVALEAVRMREAVHGASDPAVAPSLLLVAVSERAQGKYDGAEATVRRALDLKASGEGDGTLLPLEADYLEELASILFERGDSATAEPIFRDAVDQRRLLTPDDEARIAGSLQRLGQLLMFTADYEKAEPALREALRLYRENLGDDHPALGATLNGLALVLHYTGRYEEAEPLYEKMFEISQATKGGRNRRTGVAINNLGLLKYDQGELEEAESYFRRAVFFFRDLQGDRHPDVAFPLNNLARTLADMRRWREAESDYREALSIRTEALDPDNQWLADTLTWLGALLTETGRLEEAETHLREAVRIRRTQLEPGDWQIGESENLLGAALAAGGRFDEAEPLLLDGYAKVRLHRGDEWHRSRKARARVASMYEAWGRPESALAYRALQSSSG